MIDNDKRSISLKNQWPATPEGYVIIPYDIEAFHDTITDAINTVNAAINCGESGQNVGWVPRDPTNPDHNHFVRFVNEDNTRQAETKII